MSLLTSSLKLLLYFNLYMLDEGDVLALDSPFKERDSWKGKAETMELKCANR